MIEVTYDRPRHSLSVRGHGGGEYGSDTLCAAASALVYTLAENVERLCASEPGNFRRKKLRLEPGDAEISISPVHGRDSVTTLIFDAVCAGFEVLERAEPERMRYREAGKK